MIASAPVRLPVDPAQTDLSALNFNALAVIGVTLLGAATLLGAVRPDLAPLWTACQMSGRRLGLGLTVITLAGLNLSQYRRLRHAVLNR